MGGGNNGRKRVNVPVRKAVRRWERTGKGRERENSKWKRERKERRER